MARPEGAVYCEDGDEDWHFGHCTYGSSVHLSRLGVGGLSSVRRQPRAVSAELDRRRSRRLEKDGVNDKEETCVKRRPPPRRLARRGEQRVQHRL